MCAAGVHGLRARRRYGSTAGQRLADRRQVQIHTKPFHV
jgi:hypothetical protein